MTDLLLETDLNDEQQDYVNAARGCAENLLEILNVTLEFSALAANHVRLEENEFSLRETLEGVIAEFAPKAESKGLRLTGNLDRSLPDAAVGDAVRLRRLLWHLLSNAIKFTSHGEVELAASTGPSSGAIVPVTIAVRDTGIGIAPDQVLVIFEGFQQVESGLARNFNGLGLGLAVCQKLSSLLGGSITVESDLGRGSTFFVHVPLRIPSEAAPPAPAAPQNQGTRSGGGRQFRCANHRQPCFAAQRL
jgi:signal transduction histidine kinase